jgi:hypothetical protein
MTDTPAIRRTLDQHERRRARRALIRSALRGAFLAVLVLVAYYVAPVQGRPGAGVVVRIVAVGVAATMVVIWEIRAVAKAEFPRIRAVDALIASVSVLVVGFALTYLNLAQQDPRAFTEPLERTSSLYFTMTTLTTVGYGDIAARTDGARIAVMVQMVFNVAVIGTTVRAILGTARQRAGMRSPTSS